MRWTVMIFALLFFGACGDSGAGAIDKTLQPSVKDSSIAPPAPPKL